MYKALVKYGANFRVVDFQELLIRGIDCDHMQHLLKRHLKLETLSSSCTFTSTAARRGDLTTLKLLVRYGAPVDPVDAATKRSVLHLMADRTRPQTRLAEFLITRGANTNSCDIRGVTPLMVTSMHGNVSLSRLFLHAGAIVDLISQDGVTAISYAERGSIDNLIHLLRNFEQLSPPGTKRRRYRLYS